MYFSLDRITETVAVLIGDDGSIRSLPCEQLTHHAEGDLFYEEGGSLVFVPAATDARRASMKARLGRIIQKNKNQ